MTKTMKTQKRRKTAKIAEKPAVKPEAPQAPKAEEMPAQPEANKDEKPQVEEAWAEIFGNKLRSTCLPLVNILEKQYTNVSYILSGAIAKRKEQFEDMMARRRRTQRAQAKAGKN
jgi:hypothetical protein